MIEEKTLTTVLEVNKFVTSFTGEKGKAVALDGVSFELRKGETLGIVGESGSGKSVTSLSIMGLLPKPAGKIESGEINYENVDLTKISLDELRKLRGGKIAMIFQEPMTALNPVKRVGAQLVEVFDIHFPSMTKEEKIKKSIEYLDRVGIPSPENRFNDYPHQLSGGMRQRVVIAMALCGEPEVLIADEPTTALDVTIQAQILELLKSLQKEREMSIIFITHDLGVIAQLCDRVVVMYAGKVAEIAPVDELFEKPLHPYTRGLLASIPNIEDEPKKKLNTIEGMVPSLFNMPSGCRFQNRCSLVQESCMEVSPNLVKISEQRFLACPVSEGKVK